MQKDAIVRILKKALPDLKSRYPLHHLAIFGSVARMENSAQSDVDILVDVDPSIGLSFIDLTNELEHLLGTSVDVATSRGLNPKLKKRIEKELIHVG